MRVLAIDPGFGRCGVAVLEKQGGREHLVYSECIETSKTADFPMRLAAVADEVARLAKKHGPDAVAMESLFVTKNQKTAMRVAEVRGAIIYVAESLDLPVHQYTPGQIKAAVGYGGADKRQVAAMIRALVRIEKDIRFDDEYDAIAVGVTHLACSR
jgi:crossover junction endodeoxyribonuclease RuvC